MTDPPDKPMPPRPTYVAGESEDLKAVLDAFEARTEGLVALAENVSALIVEVGHLRGAIEARPNRSEVDRKRRRAVVAVALYTLLSLFAIDQHTEDCGPAHRIQGIIDSFLAGGSGEEIRAVGEDESSRLCDLAVPVHDHDGNGWPGPYNLFGIALYGVTLGGAFAWANRPNRGTNRRVTDTKDTT